MGSTESGRSRNNSLVSCSTLSYKSFLETSEQICEQSTNQLVRKAPKIGQYDRELNLLLINEPTELDWTELH